MKPIIVITMMNDEIFKAFSHFNAFVLNFRGGILALFPVVLTLLGFINLKTGSTFLFYLFSAVGIILPAFYLLFYKISINKQINAYQLKTPRWAYTITLTDELIRVVSTNEETTLHWNQVYRVFLLNDYVYLYLTKARAFILPYSDITDGAPEDLRLLLTTALPSIRVINKQR